MIFSRQAKILFFMISCAAFVSCAGNQKIRKSLFNQKSSPFDDIYGAGLEKKDLLDSNRFLKIPPEKWHKRGSQNQAQNNLGFALMGLRDFYRELIRD